MILQELGLKDLELRVVFKTSEGGDGVHSPDLIRLAEDGMFIAWQRPPKELEALTVEWANNPFLPGVWRCACKVRRRSPDGLEVLFEHPAPATLRDWFSRTAGSLESSPDDATLSTSRLYTSATVVSACGLFCGAAAMLLPIIIGNRPWVDLVAKILLVAMVASIAGFAWLRALAGRAELRALRQNG